MAMSDGPIFDNERQTMRAVVLWCSLAPTTETPLA